MNRIACSLSLLAFSTTGLFAGGKDPAGPVPAYEVKNEVQITGNVAGVREVTSGPLQGIYLMVKTDGRSAEIYLGPADFVKMFDLQFKNGKEVEVVGSKVKFEDKNLVLGREVTIGPVTMVLRDATGAPNWLWLMKRFPTGL